MKPWGYVLIAVGVAGAGFLIYKAVAPAPIKAIPHSGPASTGNGTADTINAVANVGKALPGIISAVGGLFGDSGSTDSDSDSVSV